MLKKTQKDNYHSCTCLPRVNKCNQSRQVSARQTKYSNPALMHHACLGLTRVEYSAVHPNIIIIIIIFTNRLVSTTAHGYHCAPTPTPTTFKETARSETSLAEPPTGGGGVVGSVANPPFGGVAPFRGSALSHTAGYQQKIYNMISNSC